MENHIQKLKKVDKIKIRQIKTQAKSENLKLQKINNDLENDLNDLKVNIDLIKRQKINEMASVKESCKKSKTMMPLLSQNMKI